MNKRTAESVSFNLRVLIGLLIALTGVIVALLGFGTFAAAGIAQAQRSDTTTNLINFLIPVGFDCSKIHELVKIRWAVTGPCRFESGHRQF
jgi:hypothetical protein